MSALLVLCVLIPIVTAALAFLWPGTRPVSARISVAGMLALLAAALLLLREVMANGVLVAHMGGWDAPMGITLVADPLGALLVVVAAVVGLAVSIHAIDDIPDDVAANGFDSFLHLLIAGVVGAFLTGDIFNLYVWFEVMLISSFALMVPGGDRVRLDGAVKYIVLNLVSTVVLLTSIGLLYGLTGTLNMADLAGKLPLVANQGLVTVVSVLFLVAFGIKAAVFPLYFWLPASYHTLPISVSALFAALMTKVGVYAALRTFTLLFTGDEELIRNVVLAAALATMIVGVLGAMTHTDMRRILAYHVISSIGFMLLGLGLGSALAMSASIFYMVHGILVKALLFMLIGLVASAGGSFELGRLGGLYRTRPGFSMLFLLAALALVGIPPLSGFWAKLALVEAGIDSGAGWVLAILLLTSLLTFVPMIRIWSEAFWKDAPVEPGQEDIARPPTRGPERDSRLIPVIGLSLLLLAIGLQPGPLLALADSAAAGLLDPSRYIDGVLGAAGDQPVTGQP